MHRIWTKIGSRAKAEIWSLTQGQILEFSPFRSLTQQSGQSLDWVKSAYTIVRTTLTRDCEMHVNQALAYYYLEDSSGLGLAITTMHVLYKH